VVTNKKVGGFQLFWAAHKNWAIIFCLMLIHGPQFWIWFMWPLMLVISDRLLQRQRRKSTVRLESAELLKANVMKLTFKQPRGFLYQAGHYAQIACEQVSQEEWHPFTISSAPEEEYLTMHIRCPDELDWCSALRRTLIEEPVKAVSQGKATAKPGCRVTFGHFRINSMPGQADEDLKYDIPQSVEVAGSNFNAAPPAGRVLDESKIDIEDVSTFGLISSFPKGSIRMWLDGPHGAPSELVWVHRTVILVGAGIGVTPFASILRSIQMRTQTEKSQPHRSAWWKSQTAATSAGPTAHRIEEQDWQPCQKVYFYWLCRGQDEIEWFYDMLREATQGVTAGRVVVNLFTTGEIELSKVKPLGCGFHQFFGRPNWGRIFPKLAEQHPGDDIGVFLCGPSALRGDLANGARKAKTQCALHGTKFRLHAENF
jgi:NADPH oxidase